MQDLLWSYTLWIYYLYFSSEYLSQKVTSNNRYLPKDVIKDCLTLIIEILYLL